MQTIILFLIFLLGTSVGAQSLDFTFRNFSSTSLSQGGRIVLLPGNVITYYDQDLEQYVVVTNLKNTAELRVIITDSKHKVKKVFRAPRSSLVRPFSINSIDFYPSRSDLNIRRDGILLVRTNRGDLIVNLWKQTSEFVIYGREFFAGSFEDVPIVELTQLK